jgi:hypothetical protein
MPSGGSLRCATRAGYDPPAKPGRTIDYARCIRIEFERFCDRISERAAARRLTEERLAEILADEG